MQYTILLAIGVGLFVLFYLNPIFPIYGYRLTETHLEVTLFRRIPVRRVAYAEIMYARRASWSEVLSADVLIAERLGNSIFGPMIVIRRKQGMLKSLIITPADPDGFMKALRAKIPSK